MKEFFEFLRKLGGLHDSMVERFCWIPTEQSMEFHVEDLYSNFLDLPEYPGKQSGMIRLRGIRGVLVNVETSERLRIFEFLPKEGECDVALITFSPSGKIEVSFSAADFPTVGLR